MSCTYEAVKESGLLLSLDTAEETDDGDDAVEGDGLERLGHRVGTADFKNVLHTTAAGGKLLCLLAPVGDILVVDNVISTQGLELVAFGSGRGSRNNLRASRFRELHGKHAHAASTLGKNPVTGLETTALQAVKSVPRRETGAGESAALQEIEVGGHADEALLVEGAVLPESAIDGATHASADAVQVQGACEVTLVKESEDLVAFLEAGDAGADGFNYTGTVGGRDNRSAQGEWVKAFDDGEVAVVERGAVDWVLLAAFVRRVIGW